MCGRILNTGCHHEEVENHGATVMHTALQIDGAQYMFIDSKLNQVIRQD